MPALSARRAPRPAIHAAAPAAARDPNPSPHLRLSAARTPGTAGVAGGLECRGRSGGKAITDMDVRSYIEENSATFFSELKQWLAIPSISADPSRHADVRASARWLAAHLRGIGFPQVEIWESGDDTAPGLPSVYACWPAADPAAPTVCVYGHHDVQPV